MNFANQDWKARSRLIQPASSGQWRIKASCTTSAVSCDTDLIAFFDCLHDMADPAGAARHTRDGVDRAAQIDQRPTQKIVELIFVQSHDLLH